jgi:ribonuclease-3
MSDTSGLEKALGVSFKEPALLRLALVHSSYTHENPDWREGHNERLEFLGDAVLNLVVAEALYREEPAMTEGEMTKRRVSLVRRETLARAARAVGLGEYLRLGKGEEATGGRNKAANLEAALEAVIAAVYLDRGLAAARGAVLKLLAAEWDRPVAIVRDYKSPLQEATLSRYRSIPEYRLVGEAGPAHDKRFQVSVIVEGKVLGQASGTTKKAAENEAARQALARLDKGFTDER